ncbi:helix-turn-helix domain-containing protein [Marinifilum fragile]|uniref:helix-turn-helix domain-containing protein n=1 Tax=Marinifilum fragile TaxID=570161 RepID=UPI002AA6E3F0|nr:helix-turn-helix domain-containing protein [Marinifilum fragile]
MEYRENKIDGFLSNFIRCFWEFETPTKDVNYTILPDGHFDLIFEIRKNELSNISLTGVWTKPINVQIDKDTKLIGIRFKLIAAEYIFKQSMKNILNTTTNFSIDFFALKNFPFNDFDLLTDYLLKKINYGLKKLKEIDSRKFKLFELLYENKGNLKVNELAEKTLWSSRQINRYFNAKFGFSLKTFSNILKCNSTYRQIANGKLFPQQDYFDQAHFIKEIKKYTGTTPKELYKNENDRFLQLSTLMTS